MGFARAHVRELANPAGNHYSSLASSETETGITSGNKTWFTWRTGPVERREWQFPPELTV
ncbi:MAG: hypothetical protein ACI88G_002125 [Woeseiaceae bacterium]|jgi:hypothetical protein